MPKQISIALNSDRQHQHHRLLCIEERFPWMVTWCRIRIVIGNDIILTNMERCEKTYISTVKYLRQHNKTQHRHTAQTLSPSTEMAPSSQSDVILNFASKSSPTSNTKKWKHEGQKRDQWPFPTKSGMFQNSLKGGWFNPKNLTKTGPTVCNDTDKLSHVLQEWSCSYTQPVASLMAKRVSRCSQQWQAAPPSLTAMCQSEVPTNGVIVTFCKWRVLAVRIQNANRDSDIQTYVFTAKWTVRIHVIDS